MDANEKNLGDYIAMVRRRKWQIIIPIVLLTLLSIVVAKVLPSVYRSIATILVEGQEIPKELVRSTVTSYADQHIQVISQHVMTRASLSDIITKFDLYKEDHETKTRDELVQTLREKISLEMIRADVINPRSGRPQQATIAFTLAFESKSPETAQRVLSEIVTLYLKENIKIRRRQAAEASQFFSNEAGRLSQDVSTLEGKLATFMEENIGRLPEQAQLNIQLMERTEREVQDTYRHIQALQERQIFLNAELRQTEPNRIITSQGQPLLTPVERLQALESEYSRLQFNYSENHPDRIRLERQIKALRLETGNNAAVSNEVDNLKSVLAEQQAEYEAIILKYNFNHPDALKLKRMVEALKTSLVEKMAASRGKTKHTASDSTANNPSYIALKFQLRLVDVELKAAKQQYKSLKSKLEDYENRLITAPQIERQYHTLTRNYESAERKFQEIKAKQLESEVAQQLERGAKAERFTLLEPPVLPTKPVKPNRLAIMFLGLVFAVGAGVGLASIVEAMDTSIHGVAGLLTVVNKPPLAVIPYIENSLDQRRDTMQLRLIGVGAMVSVIVLLVIIHFMWIPMDVAWLVLRREIFG